MQAFARLSSSAASRRVIAGFSCAVTRPCYRTWRGKAHAAPLSAQEPPKGQKRMSKDARRCRIEEYVQCYQASNDGKFPTIKNIRQHAGGSHYTVRDVLQEMMYKQTKSPLDHSKAAQLHETTEYAEQSRPKDSGNDSFNPQRFNGQQDADGTLLSQKDPATGTIIMEKTEQGRSLESQDSADYNGETEVVKQVLYTPGANDSTISEQAEIDSMKAEASVSFEMQTKADYENRQGEAEVNKSHLNNGETEVAMQVLYTADANVSEQAEIDSMKSEVSVSLEIEAKEDSVNCHGETEVKKLHLRNVEKLQNASERTVSDRTESDKVIEGNVPDREDDPEIKHQGSTKTSLLGSLKSFASGIRNFWKTL